MLNVIEEFNKCGGFDYAFLTTYEFTPGFFEDRVLGTAALRSCPNIVILVDEEKYQALCHDPAGGRLINRRYMLMPVTMPHRFKGVFHPKLWLFTGKDKAKLFIGSSNITRSGLTSNLEMVSCFDYEKGTKNSTHIYLFKSAYDFIRKVVENHCIYSDTLKQALKQVGILSSVFSEVSKANDNISVVHNLEEPILGQLLKSERFDSANIKILSPYFDQNIGEILSAIAKKMKIHNIEIIVQQNTNTLDIVPLRKWHNKNKNTRLSTKLLSAPGRKFHAKILVLDSSSNNIVLALIGSANFTKAALLNNSKDEGNIESCLLLKNEAAKAVIDAIGNEKFALKETELGDIQPLLNEKREIPNEDDKIKLYHAELVPNNSIIKVKCKLSSDLLNPKSIFSLSIQKLGSSHPDTICSSIINNGESESLSFNVEPQDISMLSRSATVAIHAKKDDVEYVSNCVWLLNIAELHESVERNDIRIAEQFKFSGKGLIDFITNYIDDGMVDKAINLLRCLNIRFESGGKRHAPPIRRSPHSPITEDGLPPNIWLLTTDQRKVFANTITNFITRHYEKVLQKHIRNSNLNGLENYLDVMETCADLGITAIKQNILSNPEVYTQLLYGFHLFSGNNLSEGYFRELWRKYYDVKNTLKEAFVKHRTAERIIAYCLFMKTIDAKITNKKMEFMALDDIYGLTTTKYLSHFFELTEINKDTIKQTDEITRDIYTNYEYCKVRFEYSQKMND